MAVRGCQASGWPAGHLGRLVAVLRPGSWLTSTPVPPSPLPCAPPPAPPCCWSTQLEVLQEALREAQQHAKEAAAAAERKAAEPPPPKSPTSSAPSTPSVAHRQQEVGVGVGVGSCVGLGRARGSARPVRRVARGCQAGGGALRLT